MIPNSSNVIDWLVSLNGKQFNECCSAGATIFVRSEAIRSEGLKREFFAGSMKNFLDLEPRFAIQTVNSIDNSGAYFYIGDVWFETQLSEIFNNLGHMPISQPIYIRPNFLEKYLTYSRKKGKLLKRLRLKHINGYNSQKCICLLVHECSGTKILSLISEKYDNFRYYLPIITYWKTQHGRSGGDGSYGGGGRGGRKRGVKGIPLKFLELILSLISEKCYHLR